MNERSNMVERRFLPPKTVLTLMVDCTGHDVKASWKLMSYLNIDEYCFKYWCGSIEKEMVSIYMHVYSL